MLLQRPANRGIGSFENEPDVRILRCPPGSSPNYIRVRFLAQLRYHTCDGRLIIAPIDLVSDGASIPVEAEPIMGFPISSQNAAFGGSHDSLYRFGGLLVLNPDGSFSHVIPLSKEECDLYAEDMALCSGHSPATAHEIYLALATCGQKAWEENAAKRAACGDLRVPANYKGLIAMA